MSSMPAWLRSETMLLLLWGLLGSGCVSPAAVSPATTVAPDALAGDGDDSHKVNDDDRQAATNARSSQKPVESSALRQPSDDPQKRMVVHLLDVGQGAATLVEFPCGALLVDTGGEENEAFDGVARLQEQLDAFFRRRVDLNRTLDTLVITHPHIDHVRGVPMVLREYIVKNIVDDGRDGDDLVKGPLQTLRAYVDEHRVGYRAVTDEALNTRGGLRDAVIDPFVCQGIDPSVRVLSGGMHVDPGWGTDKYGKLHFDNDNNHSVVVRVDFGNASLLVTGDLEERAIAGLLDRYRGTRWLDVDVYQVGHHGSHNGTTRALLTAMSPDLALISMGNERRHLPWTAWTYGHPREDVVEHLEESVATTRPRRSVEVARAPKTFAPHGLSRAIYATGWDGAVDVIMDVEGRIAVVAPASSAPEQKVAPRAGGARPAAHARPR
jgi:competence protein ComEC